MDNDDDDIIDPETGIDTSLFDTLLDLTPTERLLRHEQMYQTYLLLREAGTKIYGFDPRTVIEAE